MPEGHTLRLLITAGPTHEPIDAVRYLANRSSGRLGIALAEVSARRGHPTTLLLGPTPLQPPESTPIDLRRFRTTGDLRAILAETWPDHDVLIMAAAVADYRPAASDTSSKMPRSGGPISLALEPTEDLLAEAARTARPDQRLIGFALEPAERLLDSARRKLASKKVHAIVANPIETMDSDRITARILLADGRMLEAPSDLPKPDFAQWLLDHLAEIVGLSIQ